MAYGYYDGVEGYARRSFPISQEEIITSQQDYIALGHWPVFRCLCSEPMKAYYCDSPSLTGTLAIVDLSEERGEVEEEVREKTAEVEVHSFASTGSWQGRIGVASVLVTVGQELNSASAIERMPEKLRTEEDKKVYGKRKEIAEPVFWTSESQSGICAVPPERTEESIW